MKLVVQVKLVSSPVQAAALEATLSAVNEAANWVSGVAHAHGVPREYALRKLAYGELKARGLGAQAAQHVIKKVRDAYTALQGNLRAGNLGRCGSVERWKVESKPVEFRPDAAQPYYDRYLSWQFEPGTVSIWTVHGRMKAVPFACSPQQLATLRNHRRGESDLVLRDGVFYVVATCEIPETPLNEDPARWIGVDLGIVNIATTSAGYQAAGRGLNRHRKRLQELRAKLQKKRTKSAQRALKRINRVESHRLRDANHVISKCIVAEAERTRAGIGLEDLSGIRRRARSSSRGRAALHGWSFAQLGQFIACKARRAGVPVVHVDPAFTSQTCSRCSHVERRNRVRQSRFVCRSCGLALNADRNASRNIARRAEAAWDAGAAVSRPYRRRIGGWTRE
ncbi:MAG TPA: transposase [Actinospica sp.]|nr:transposase [Actinospica sp.]